MLYLKKHLLRNRKGMTLLEVVVGIAVVLIVTGAALTLMISSSRADVAYRDEYRALVACENAQECLRFANGDPERLYAALTAVGFTKDPDSEIYTLENGSHTVTVTLDSDNYVVKYNDETIYEHIEETEETTEETNEENNIE